MPQAELYGLLALDATTPSVHNVVGVTLHYQTSTLAPTTPLPVDSWVRHFKAVLFNTNEGDILINNK